jgi:hypothetical protein
MPSTRGTGIRPPRDALGRASRHDRQRHPGDELHHQVVATVLLAQAEGLDDVRVVELRAQAGLVEEHLHELAVLREVVVQALHDDVLLEPGRAVDPGEVDLRRAAEREQRDQLVVAEALTDERAGVGGYSCHAGPMIDEARRDRAPRRARSARAVRPASRARDLL